MRSAGLPDRRRRTEEFPLDPALTRHAGPTPGRFSRIAQLERFRVEAPDRLVTDQRRAMVVQTPRLKRSPSTSGTGTSTGTRAMG